MYQNVTAVALEHRILVVKVTVEDTKAGIKIPNYVSRPFALSDMPNL